MISHSFPTPPYYLLCIHDLDMAIGLLLSDFNMAIAISSHMKYNVKNHLVVVHNRLPHTLVLSFVYFHFSWLQSNNGSNPTSMWPSTYATRLWKHVETIVLWILKNNLIKYLYLKQGIENQHVGYQSHWKSVKYLTSMDY
jgi:hypothetical protein